MSAIDRVFNLSPVWLRGAFLNAQAARLAWFREGSPLLEKVRALDHVDRADRSEVAAHQLSRINDLLSWCTQQVPYYRAAWGTPEPQLASLDGLSGIPILTKATVRAAGSSLHADHARYHSGRTSGTTGTPLELAYDREQRVWNRAAERLVRLRAGLRIEDPVAVAWGRKVVPLGRRRPPYWLQNAVDNELWLSAFHLSRETIADYFAAIRGFGALALETYPSIAYTLASLGRELNLSLRLPRVLTTSETLYPFQREFIQEFFDTEVFDYYGAAERVAFAIECSRHEGLHLLEGFGYVEPTVRDTGFIATGLTNRASPLIRYWMEDATQLIDDPCACGLTSRRLSAVTTKAEDILVAPDGRFISPSTLTHPFKPLVGLIRSQIVQEAIDRVDVYLETGPGWDVRQEASIAEGVAERMGSAVRVEVHRVERLEQPIGGKFRWVVCKLPKKSRPNASRPEEVSP